MANLLLFYSYANEQKLIKCLKPLLAIKMEHEMMVEYYISCLKHDYAAKHTINDLC